MDRKQYIQITNNLGIEEISLSGWYKYFKSNEELEVMCAGVFGFYSRIKYRGKLPDIGFGNDTGYETKQKDNKSKNKQADVQLKSFCLAK